jgi:hypothetical protein
MMRSLFSILLLSFLLGCASVKLPTERYVQYQYNKSYTYQDDELRIALENPLHCPLRIWVLSEDQVVQARFNEINPVLLDSKTDTVLTFLNTNPPKGEISFSSRLGSTSKEIKKIALDLPFKEGKRYRVIQGNNTDFTHKGSWSGYALDLGLKVGDTVCAATGGFVVGVIDQYKFGGEGKEWEPFANFVTLYEPISGLFTQYVHLKQDGSLVKVGDQVERGQPIALSGMTGQTNVEHLHFNCLVPVNTNEGLESIPYEFVGGIQSQGLKAGDMVSK